MEVRPGYKQTEAGVIPEDWGTVRLPDVVWYQEGPGVRNYQFTSAGVKLFNGTNIENGRICLEKTSRYISEREAYGWYSHFLADAGDIVIACSGITVSRFDEKVSVLSSEHLPLCMNTSTMRFKIASPRLHKDYFRHFLRSQLFKDQISGKATGSAQLNFGPAHVSAALVPLPTKAEQEAIAEALSDADALIESLEQLLAKKRHLKQGAMQELLSGKKRLPGFEQKPGYKQTEVGVIPEDWEVETLAVVCSMKSGEGITSVSIDPFSAFPCFGGNGLRGFTTRFTHDGCYTLIGRVGALCGNVLGVEGKFFASEHAIVVAASTRTDTRWLAFVLGEMRLNQYSESSAQPVLTVSKLLRLKVARPPEKAEQTAIAAILSNMDAEISALEAKLTKDRQLKQGMMQELLTGRIRLV
jgi:type I restriction enzyme S subunit